jgi:glycosylphosphatidylinositol transamidase
MVRHPHPIVFDSILESTLRSLNNILERLHASVFFYLFVNPDHYSQVGSYLPAAIILSAVVTLGGLHRWIDAGWHLVKDPNDERGRRRQWRRRPRQLGSMAAILLQGFAMGSAALLGLKRIACLPVQVSNPYSPWAHPHH